MGDAADQDFEAGMDEWCEHLAGRCGEYGPCPYCEDEEDLEDACLDCYGSGQCQACDGGTDEAGAPCGYCDASETCPSCDGTGEDPDHAP